ncbi:Crp/Fnr family transcriptional regulator [Dechloromonas sp. A34]|uniref:Crp/Fnr family transcriptional regulator n=1 Tax=Dechloromonas sp. A34 TaxID=447588 RepID=UPI002249808B|nr:Crp/Fnr family transcriptional regulator [Dechloromonas sp. A34]
MCPLPSNERSSKPGIRLSRTLEAGQAIYQAGGDGLAWRVRHGVVRLDTPTINGETTFASLAIGGDILGCETLLFGCYTFTASALTRCELNPWPEGEPAIAGEALLASLTIAQRRAADIVALRGGQAVDRVIGLIRLLTDSAGQVVLPTRQDIADITDLRFETISRIIKSLERARVLAPLRIAGVHATRSFQVDLAATAY